MRRKKYSVGGQLLASGASFIPGVGGLLGSLISGLDQKMSQQKQAEMPLVPPIPNSNIFGNLRFGGPILPPPQESVYVQPRPLQNLDMLQLTSSPELQLARQRDLQDSILSKPYFDSGKGLSFKSRTPRLHIHEKALGGIITDDFIQYHTGSHASGNDQTVNAQGIPGKGNSSVQNKENSHKGYVLSDVLINPETGNTFNIDAAQINKDHPKARFQTDVKQALDFKMGRLKALNDSIRMLETAQKAFGRPLGNPEEPVRNKPWVDASGKINYPDSGYTIEAFQNNDFNVPKANNPFDIQVEYPSDRNMAGDPTQVINAPEIQLGNPAIGKSAPAPRSFTNSRSRQTDNTNYQIDSRTLNGLGLLSKSLALAGSVSDAFSTAEKERDILPNYRQADAYMKSSNIDYTQARQDALGVSNIAGNTNRSLSTNAGQFQGREQSRLAGLQDALGRIDMQENNAQSQLNLTRGQYELSKAIRDRDIQYQTTQNNQANQANARFADRVLFQELDNIGSSFNKAGEVRKVMQNQRDMQQFNNSQIMLALQNKYPNFRIKSDIVNKFNSGQISLDEFLEYVPDDFKQEVKRG